MDIKVYGTATSGHQMAISVLSDFLLKAQIPFHLEEVTNVTKFLEKGIESVPAIQLNDGAIYSLKSNGSFINSLRKAVGEILSSENFGNLPKVVIPLDFSDVSVNAFSYGHRLATDMQAITKAIHAYVPEGEAIIENNTLTTQESQSIVNKRFSDFVAVMNTDWGSDILKASLIEGKFEIGFPADKILESAEENDAELIVMGTTGASNIKKVFGSVSTKVMKQATCPVLLVPYQASYKGINKVLYAYDDIELDKSIIDKLTTFTKHFGAELHLVHVQTGKKIDPGYYLKDLVKSSYPDDKIVLSTFYNPDVVEALTEYVETNNIDIISLATKNRNFFQELFHDSITEKMAIQTKTPLLILK